MDGPHMRNQLSEVRFGKGTGSCRVGVRAGWDEVVKSMKEQSTIEA